LEKRLLALKRDPKLVPHGYPVAEVTDLLDTIRSLKTLKKRYQRLADRRAKTIAEVYSLTSRSISVLDDLSDIPSVGTEL
jgi:hypothetical protein